ncbi:MAG: hypothetical protein PUB93_07870 [Firmicutes bacterium]|nr:hypothetical protein [Bacillota bacterium]
MDFAKVPIGFGMALAQNEQAMTVYAGMTEAQKQAVLAEAHGVRSEEEMHALVSRLSQGIR